MGDCNNASTESAMEEAEEELIAAAQRIVKALESKKYLTEDARKILANLGLQLTNMTSLFAESRVIEVESNEEHNEIELQLNRISDKIMVWEKDESMIWDCGPDEAFEYLKAVEESRRLTEVLENRSPDSRNDDSTLLRRAHDLLQTGMNRLEDEFRHLLVQNRQPFELEHMSFRSSEEDSIIEAGSVISSGDDSVDDVAAAAVVHRDSMGRSSVDYVIELVNVDVIPDLKSIANLMFDSNYGRECSQVFVNVQKDALDDCLFILEVEKLSIEEVVKMEWKLLNSKIRSWIRAMKLFVRVYLASEKTLTERIFEDLDSVGSVCFAESSKAAVLQLLNFCEAVAVGPHQPEKLMRILDMYEVLAGVIPDIAGLYSGEAGTCVTTECKDILKRLGECAKATFLEFKNTVASSVSTNPFPGGGVHPLTKYVMNYFKTLTDYTKTLDEVLRDEKDENTPQEEEEEGPTGTQFRSFFDILETNLEVKSSLYKDEALRNLFLMNNIHYMAEKVRGSELRIVLGDEWIRKRNWKFQQHAMNYERATWSSILFLLKDEGIQNPGSNSISKTLLKERLQGFYAAFEEVYKNQSGWSIPDGRLRDDLHISTSLKVIQAYRTFVGRHINHISEKHIKYSADDLEDLLLDLFEGSQKSLHGGHRK
ncbi:hypothetical protein ABFX02_08G030800 [Erythranthe guttata]